MIILSLKFVLIFAICTISQLVSSASFKRVKRDASQSSANKDWRISKQRLESDSSPLAKVNIDNYLKNKRAMQLQIKCVIYDGPCDIVGKEVKKFVRLGLVEKCDSCSAKLNEKVEKIVNFIQENHPKAWYDAIYKYLVVPALGTSVVPPNNSNNDNSSVNPEIEEKKAENDNEEAEIEVTTTAAETVFESS